MYHATVNSVVVQKRLSHWHKLRGCIKISNGLIQPLLSPLQKKNFTLLLLCAFLVFVTHSSGVLSFFNGPAGAVFDVLFTFNLISRSTIFFPPQVFLQPLNLGLAVAVLIVAADFDGSFSLCPNIGKN